jgi:F-type H+-transporting ATPase subunit epsilon
VPLTVQIVTPEREVVVADDATLVIARGIEGEVGIMPGHAPLLIALSVGPLTIVSGDHREVLAVDGGFLQCSRDQVIVLAEFAMLPGEVDVAATESEIAELKSRLLAEAESADVKRRLARAEVAYAVARM